MHLHADWKTGIHRGTQWSVVMNVPPTSCHTTTTHAQTLALSDMQHKSRNNGDIYKEADSLFSEMNAGQTEFTQIHYGQTTPPPCRELIDDSFSIAYLSPV